MKPKHQRLIFVAVSVGFLCMATILALRAFRDNVVFFYTPSELIAQPFNPDVLVRTGGLVKGSGDSKAWATFGLTDGVTTLAILCPHEVVLPGLFREGQGMVVEGHRTDPTHIKATRVFAKHDEYYMPKDVVDALKKTGQWKGGK
jgi:cytochrome c-type biogenesis protein CcmE